MKTDIKYHLVESYKGIDIYIVETPAGPRFVAWMEKFYSAINTDILHAFIDGWWNLRRN